MEIKTLLDGVTGNTDGEIVSTGLAESGGIVTISGITEATVTLYGGLLIDHMAPLDGGVFTEDVSSVIVGVFPCMKAVVSGYVSGTINVDVGL